MGLEIERRKQYLYLNDPQYHALVEALINVMKNTHLTTVDLLGAVDLATTKYLADTIPEYQLMPERQLVMPTRGNQ